MNACRHGLATRLGDIPELFDKLERLAAILSEGRNDLLVPEEARIIAECHLELQRIRAVQRGLFHDILRVKTMGDLGSRVSALAQIGRYARRAVSKRKTALNRLVPEQD